jgi:uncharacterized protein YbbC (DUF1343 family)
MKPSKTEPDRIRVGLEKCLESPPELLQGARFGLLMNQASVDASFQYAHHAVARRFPGKLKALFSPQHGFFGQQQDNMIETPHGFDRVVGAPVYSLYHRQRWPAADMLDGLDVLVIDLQDVGTRVYTFIWTASYCLQACREAGIPVLVLDRPNPIGGQRVEGPPVASEFCSFVGRAPIPMRHGLTMAELVAVVNDLLDIGAEVYSVPLDGWARSMTWPDTGRVWIPPSPNLPRLEGVAVYPGQVLCEGTNLSEGRGTTTPFEVCGAPYVDAELLLNELGHFRVDGAVFRPVRFEPTFQKHCGQSCHGLFIHVVDPEAYRPYRASVSLLACAAQLWPHDFAWKEPPYEYETERLPIDILSGNTAIRDSIDQRRQLTEDDVEALCDFDVRAWREIVSRHLLYGNSEDLAP